MMEISQNFGGFSEYMNFNRFVLHGDLWFKTIWYRNEEKYQSICFLLLRNIIDLIKTCSSLMTFYSTNWWISMQNFKVWWEIILSNVMIYLIKVAFYVTRMEKPCIKITNLVEVISNSTPKDTNFIIKLA